jgi:hypothetical protein
VSRVPVLEPAVVGRLTSSTSPEIPSALKRADTRSPVVLTISLPFLRRGQVGSGQRLRRRLLCSGPFEERGDSPVGQNGQSDCFPATLAFLVERMDCGRGARGVAGRLEAGKLQDQVLPGGGHASSLAQGLRTESSGQNLVARPFPPAPSCCAGQDPTEPLSEPGQNRRRPPNRFGCAAGPSTGRNASEATAGRRLGPRSAAHGGSG